MTSNVQPQQAAERLMELASFPDELLTVPAALIKRVLPAPTLIHIEGRATAPIFVSVLLHGNEDVGLKAVQQVMANYRTTALPRSLSIFVGNVDAAEAAVRYLPHQADFNRVWPGSDLNQTSEHAVMRRVVEVMIQRQVAASIDLHNNSGRNPYYACICSLNAEHLQLASLFSRRVLYFLRPKGVQTQAFAQFCPSITCECGPIGDPGGVRAAVELLERTLALCDTGNTVHAHPCEFRTLLPPASSDVELYHTIATWRIANAASLSFAKKHPADVLLRADLDLLNFVQLEAGEALGQLTRPLLECVEVRDESGRLVTTEFLKCSNGQLQLTRSVLPSMFTVNTDAIRKDCVGYFTERYPRDLILNVV
jgi:succinylglutamate desuccinylase